MSGHVPRDDRGRRSGGGAPLRQLRILLVGLGDVGRAVLEHLHQLDHAEILVFDATGPGTRGAYRARRASTTAGRESSSGPAVRWVEAKGRSPGARAAALEAAARRVSAVLSCIDPFAETVERLVRVCRTGGVPMVAAAFVDSTGMVGPVGLDPAPDAITGCTLCAAHYRCPGDLRAGGRAVPDHHGPGNRQPDPGRRITPARDGVAVLAQLAVLAVCKALEIRAGRRPADNRIVSVALHERTVEIVSPPKHHACRLCFPARRSSATLLRQEAEHDWIAHYRAEPVAPLDLAEVWNRLQPFVATELGLFSTIHQLSPTERRAVWRFFGERGVNPRANELANAHRALSIRAGSHGPGAVSEALDPEDPRAAGALALVEGLERLFTLDYCDPRRIVPARYSALKGEALDPRRFPLYAEGQYRDPGFGVRRFDPEESIPWVWGVRVVRDEPVLVPLDLVGGTAVATRIFRATTSGSACHTSFHHAVLNGIYETVERDALMVVWLNRLSLPRVALTPGDPDPFATRATFEALGLELSHVDITTDLDVPVVLGILRDRRDPDLFVLDMVASLRPPTLLAKLYRELVQFLYPHLIDQRHYRTAVTQSVNPDAVGSFPDHLSFYQRSDKNQQARFLDGSPHTRPLSGGAYSARALDVGQELAILVDRLERRGHEVIVVDCTVPLVRRLGLHVVKVLIPGLQPLSAGHRYRVLGGRRVLDVAQRLGLADRGRTVTELNSWPHPFW